MKKKLLVAAAVSLLTLSSVSVMAANSPIADEYYNITIDDQTTGKEGNTTVEVPGGTITTSTGIVEVGEEVTLTADADDGYTFKKWVIEGDYTIVDGSLEEGTITIIPNEDLNVNAEFVDEDGNPAEDPGKGGDDSPVSPATGAATGGLLITLLASGGVAITSRKKMK